MPTRLPPNPPSNSLYLRSTTNNRRLTPQELRQRRSAWSFAKTFVPLAAVAYAVTSLGAFTERIAPYFSAGWSLPPSDFCGGSGGRYDLSRSVAVVTGGNSGVGYETARALALLGAGTVVLGCRSGEKCRAAKMLIDAERLSLCGVPFEASNVHVPELPLDLESLPSVSEWAASLPYGHVTHLALNAGVMSTPLHPRNPGTGAEPQLHTNHLAHYHLTASLLPLLKAAAGETGEPARVLSVSSLSAQLPFSFSIDDLDFADRRHDSLTAYAQSKRANLLFAQSLHDRLHETTGIASLAAHPGYSRTNLAVNGWSFVPESLSFLKEWMNKNPVLSMSAEEGARPSLRALLDLPGAPSGSYVTPVLYAVGVPVVSVGGRAVKWPGYGKEGGRSWPFREGLGSWVGGGMAFGEREVEGLWRWSEERSGLRIEGGEEGANEANEI